MATPRQRKKRRSSVPKQTRKTKQKHKKIQILNDKIISQNWDKKQTLEQNYERLGLAARPLELYTSGGVEKTKKGSTKVVVPKSEAVIRRNPDGSTNIVYAESDEDDVPAAPSPIPPETKVVKELMEEAARPVEPAVHHISTVQVHWLQTLIDTYGDDFEAMYRDKELNPMEHTPAQLKRKIKRWKAQNA